MCSRGRWWRLSVVGLAVLAASCGVTQQGKDALRSVGVEPWDAEQTTTTQHPIAARLSQVVDCLRAHGTDVDMPAGVGRPRTGATQPFDPAVATAAWDACRTLHTPLARDVPGATGAEQLARLDCMATKGWIMAFMGPTDDQARFDADLAACMPTPAG